MNESSSNDDPICLLCGVVRYKHLMQIQSPETGAFFSILKCTNCDLEQTHPKPVELYQYYPQTYHGGRHGLSARWCARRRLKWLQRVGAKKKGKLLDIGCGDGTFLLAAKANGWEVFGTEINPNHARSVCLEVYTDLKSFSGDCFNCITLWHVLEHMIDPNETLANVKQCLAKEGKVLIAVPNAKGWQARIFGTNWLHRDIPRHLYHFGPRQLQALLQKHGLVIEKSWHQEVEYDLLGWSQSLLNVLFSPRNVFFSLLTKREVSLSMSRVILHCLLGIFFTLLAFPAVIISTLFGKGGTIIISAKKKSPD